MVDSGASCAYLHAYHDDRSITWRPCTAEVGKKYSCAKILLDARVLSVSEIVRGAGYRWLFIRREVRATTTPSQSVQNAKVIVL